MGKAYNIAISRGLAGFYGKRLPEGVVFGNFNPDKKRGYERINFYVENPREMALRKNSYFLYIYDYNDKRFYRRCVDTHRGWSGIIWAWLDAHYEDLPEVIKNEFGTPHTLYKQDIDKISKVGYRKVKPMIVYGTPGCTGSEFLRRKNNAVVVTSTFRYKDGKGNRITKEDYYHRTGLYDDIVIHGKLEDTNPVMGVVDLKPSTWNTFRG